MPASRSRQRLEHEREHQHSAAGNSPGDERAKRASGTPERRRQGEYARTDHGADDQRNQRAA